MKARFDENRNGTGTGPGWVKVPESDGSEDTWRPRTVPTWVAGSRPTSTAASRPMECDDPLLLQRWVANWRELAEFEIVPLVEGKDTAKIFAPADTPADSSSGA